MSGVASLSEPAEKLFAIHILSYQRLGYIVGGFETAPGHTAAEIEAAYEELVAAGLMHRGRYGGLDDPGTYLLASRAVVPGSTM